MDVVLDVLNNPLAFFALFAIGLAVGGEFARRKTDLSWSQIFNRLTNPDK